MSDYIVYTASDPDAWELQKELESLGYIVIESPADAASVVVYDSNARTKKDFKKVVKGIARRKGVTYWKIAKVGKEVKI